MDLPIEVPLTRPFEVDGIKYDKLLFDELDVGSQIDFEDMVEDFEEPPNNKQSRRTTLFLLSRMTGLPENVARKIKGSDSEAVHDALNAVMEDGVKKEAVGNEEKA